MNETVFFFRTSLVSLSMAGMFCYDTVHVEKRRRNPRFRNEMEYL